MKSFMRLLLVLVGLQASMAQAVYIETGGDPSAGTAYITFNQDITFTIYSLPPVPLANPKNISFVIRQAITPNDGSKTDLTGAGLTYQISSEAFTRTVKVWRDNLAAEAGHVVRTDGQLYDTDESVNPFPQLNAGDTITLFAGTFQVNAASSAFTLMNSGDYEMFVASNNGYRVSNLGVSAVPVPAAVWLFGSGLLGLVAVARRKAA